MRHFDVIEPATLEEACAALAISDDVKVIAGGTALLTIIKQRLWLPKLLVNLKKIRDGSEIEFDPQTGLRIGALATIHQIETSPTVRERYSALADACHGVANIRIRNMATIGGNLAHGDNQSDPPTMLAALDARVELRNQRGTRRINLTDFQLGSYETALAPGELISAVLIPSQPQGTMGQYVKFTTGSAEERPCVGIAVCAQLHNGICRQLHLAIGAVSARPVRISQAEETARERVLSRQLIDDIAARAAEFVQPIDDVCGPADYKRHVVRVLTRRALEAVANGSTEIPS